MIGFFQNTMAKHHKLMFAFLLVIIVVSFVFYTGSGSAMDLLGMRKSPTVCGVKLNDAEADVYRKALALQGTSNMSQEQYIQALTQRIFLVDLAEKYEIPLPTQAEFDKFVQSYFAGADGKFDPKMVELVKQNFRISDEMMTQILVHSYRIEALVKLLAGSPAVFDDDLAIRWQEINTSWTIETARVPAKNFKFDKQPTDNEIADYFAENAEKYRIDSLLELAYAVVEPTEKMRAGVTEKPTESELKKFVRMHLPTLSNETDVEKEIAKDRPAWEKRWKSDRVAIEVAATTSDTLAEVLPQDMMNPGTDDFNAAVAKLGLKLVKIPAFPKNEIPKDLQISKEIIQNAAGALNSTLWRTDAIPSGENAIVVFFLGDKPARIPELSEVREKVIADWKTDTHETKFLEFAQSQGEKLRTAVAAGKPFEATAKSLDMTAKKQAPFTMQNVPADLLAYGHAVINAVKIIPLKTVSGMIPAGEDVLFAYASKKDVPTLNKDDATYKGYLSYMNGMVSGSTMNAQIGERIGEILDGIQAQPEE